MFKSERGCRKQCLLVPNVPASNSSGYPFCQTILVGARPKPHGTQKFLLRLRVLRTLPSQYKRNPPWDCLCCVSFVTSDAPTVRAVELFNLRYQSRVPIGLLAPTGNPGPKRRISLDTPPVRAGVIIPFPHDSCAGRTDKNRHRNLTWLVVKSLCLFHSLWCCNFSCVFSNLIDGLYQCGPGLGIK